MKKLISKLLLALCACTTLSFMGCGVLDEMLVRSQVVEMVKQHMNEQEEIVKIYEVGECSNFKMENEKNDVRNGTIDLDLKNKKTGEIKKITYEFKYNTKETTIEVGVKEPLAALRLININF